MSKVVTANNLSTGAVVFMGRADAWVGDIAAARVYADATEAETGLAIARADEKRALVVDPFVVDLKEGREGHGVGGPGTMSLRDAIRAHGPTIVYLPASSASAA